MIGVRRTYRRLNQMLEDGINGCFTESDYDESELSHLESKWLRYLANSEISKQKVEEERAHIKELIGDISHQTKTPLANLMLYSQLLQEKEMDADSRQLAEEVCRQSEKLNFLIQSLVRLSRLETGIFQLSPRRTAIMPMIKAAEEQVRPLAEKRLIKLILSEGEAGDAVFDEKWTREALINILDNAIKYTLDHGRITISVIHYEMFVCVKIEDTGIGMREEELPRIFSRFYRGSNVRDQDGVGIGLYLSRQIIENQNGYIRVESKLGAGSGFQIFLPRDKGH